MEISHSIDLMWFYDHQLSSIDVGVEDSCSESEVAGGLGHKEGVLRGRESKRFELSLLWYSEVPVLGVV